MEAKGWGADLGYFAFKPVPIEEQEIIKAHILFSDELEVNWDALDEFESDGYKRILTEFELDNGEKGIGYIYASNDG